MVGRAAVAASSGGAVQIPLAQIFSGLVEHDDAEIIVALPFGVAVGDVDVAVVRIEPDFRDAEKLRRALVQGRAHDRAVGGIEYAFLSDLQQELFSVVRIFLHDAVLGSVDPHVAFLIDRAAVQILRQNLRIAPGIDHLAVGVKLNHGRRGLPGVQFVVGQAFEVAVHPADVAHALRDEHVVLGVDAHAAHFAGHPSSGQRLGPGGIHFKFGNARLRPRGRGRKNQRRESQTPAGQHQSQQRLRFRFARNFCLLHCYYFAVRLGYSAREFIR